MSKYKTARGMHDILPDESVLWQRVETVAASTMSSYGYHQIRLPLLENTELFARSAGETSDIVQKQMYTFGDQEGSSLTLRPEGTAGCARAFIQNGLHKAGPQRLWYGGSMFRHERPQKGRYRQFDQIGVEAFGVPDAGLEAELIGMMTDVLDGIGVLSSITLELNSIGDPADRASYRSALQSYFRRYEGEIDEDSRLRLDRNPMRILDSKDGRTREIARDAPLMSDYLGDDARAHYDELRNLLAKSGVAWQENDRLVRGLDYYNRSVFEWTTAELGSQGTVCGGGRYDGLVELVGGPATPAAGFALGVDRLVLLMTALQGEGRAGVDIYVAVADNDLQGAAMQLAQQARRALPGWSVRLNQGGGRLKAQMRRADSAGARFALVLGVDEAARGEVSVKFLSEDRPQETVSIERAMELLAGASRTS